MAWEYPPQPNKIELLKDAVDKITALSFLDRANLALVALHEKPACILEFQFPAHEEAGRDETQHDISLIEEMLDTLSIPYEKRETSDDEYISIEICAGNDPQHMQTLLQAGSEPLLLGKALGYPDTAVTAFAAGEWVNQDTLPDEIKNDDAMAFLNFRLSRDHWQDEFLEVKRRAELMRTTFPELYEKIVASKKKK